LAIEAIVDCCAVGQTGVVDKGVKRIALETVGRVAYFTVVGDTWTATAGGTDCNTIKSIFDQTGRTTSI